MKNNSRWQDIANDRGDTTAAKFEREMHHCFALLRDGLLDVIRTREAAMLDVARSAITLDAFTAFFQIFDCNNQAIGVAPPLARLWSRLQGEHDDDDDDEEEADDDDDDNNNLNVVVKHEDEATDDDARADGDDYERETDSLVGGVDEAFKLRVMRTAEALRAQDDGANDARPHHYLHTNVNAAADDEKKPTTTKQCDDEECDEDHDHDDDDNDDDCEDDDDDVIDDGEEAPFRRLEGVGMFPLSATVNHSCQPSTIDLH